MKIHQIELNHVRNLKRVCLDVSSPVTVIAGRNGVGKTTVQQALLAAMFRTAKKDRDRLVSRFDPHSPPRAVLRFSRTEDVATIALSRTLTDEQGEWSEGGTTLKQKGIALEKVQESLPISAATAASLLWGVQEEMAQLLAAFPDEGHSLLTAATVRGTGPDPKDVLTKIDKQIREAKKKGQNPGPLVQAQKTLDDSQNAVQEAIRDALRFQELERQFTQAQAERERLQTMRTQLEQEVKQLAQSELLLETCLRANEHLERLQQKSDQWQKINGRIAESVQEQQALQAQLETLAAQLVVARNRDWDAEISNRRQRLQQIQQAQTELDDVRRELAERRRPDRAARDQSRTLRHRIQQAQARLEASGLRYQVLTDSHPAQLDVQEDQAAVRQLIVEPGTPVEGIVGRVVFRVGDVSIQAAGKEDVAEHKRIIEAAQAELRTLFARFETTDELEFDALAEELERLQDLERTAKTEYERRLGNRSVETLRAELEALEHEQSQQPVTEAMRQLCGDQPVPSISELERRSIQYETEFKSSQRIQAQTERERPTPAEQEQFAKDLATAQRERDFATRQFEQSIGTDTSTPPSLELRNSTQKALRTRQHELGSLVEELRSAEKRQTQYSMDLKYAVPRKTVAVLKDEAVAAEATLKREEMLQEARELLRDRIQSTIQELSEAVPRDLSARISRHLAQLTSGAYNKVTLDDQLVISGVQQSGEFPEAWKADELSTGERTMAALTVKIAVARALAEINGPIFIVLDDSLVNLDPEHRTASERLLLDLVADGKLQILFFTCHTDWAQAWRNQARDTIRYIKLEQVTDYYRTPAAWSGSEPRSIVPGEPRVHDTETHGIPIPAHRAEVEAVSTETARKKPDTTTTETPAERQPRGLF